MPRHHARLASTGAALLSLVSRPFAVRQRRGPAAAAGQRPAQPAPVHPRPGRRQGGHRGRGHLHRHRRRRAANAPVQPPGDQGRADRPAAAPAARPEEAADQAGPAQPPVTKFKVTIGADVPLGIHDVRLVNKWGVSNARAFVVGDLPEVLEKEPNNDVEQAQRIELNSTDQRHHRRPDRRRLLRLRRQEGPARRRQLPGVEHRQPAAAPAWNCTTPRASASPPTATTTATTP